MKFKLMLLIIITILFLSVVSILVFFYRSISIEHIAWSILPSSSAITVTPLPTETVITPTANPAIEVSPAPTSYLDLITNDEHIREQLYRMYGRFNGLIGNYDNYKTTTKDEWDEYLTYTFLSPSVYERFAEVTSSDELKHDFNNLAALVTFIREGLEDGIYSEKDIIALRFACEIINDVQAWSLSQRADNLNVRHKFGASFTLEEHEQASKINEWINNNL